MIDRLLDFLEIDAETKAAASQLSDLLAPRMAEVIDDFYSRVSSFHINKHINAKTIAVLKKKQKQHWLTLLESRFDEKYLAGIYRIGMRHREVSLNTMWYVAGYMRFKLAFIEIIIKSDLPVVTKGHLVKTLEKYVAIDMALALSTYDAVMLE